MAHIPLDVAIPGLRLTRWENRSPDDFHYNCIAFAVGDTHQWWEPSGYRIHYWPPGVDVEYTVGSYTKIYEIHGYKKCQDGRLEKGVEKIALFVDDQGIPSHASYQKDNGVWVSKCGEWEDIEHDSVEALQGADNYGTIVTYLGRPRISLNKGCFPALRRKDET
jgi:hypothetical protein